jgi:predicted DNA-binding transcriptional regulator YafY
MGATTNVVVKTTGASYQNRHIIVRRPHLWCSACAMLVALNWTKGYLTVADQMTPARPRGDKRGSWATFRRRLILVRRLLRGPATVDELIAAAEAEQGADAYPPAAAIAVKHDLQSLRDEFGCAIGYNRTQQSYLLEELGDLALLDLPDDGIEALVSLDAAFPDDAPSGSHERIRLLINRLFALLPKARREQIGRPFTLPRVRWSASYDEKIDAATIAAVKKALSLGRQLAFEYHSNYDPDDRPLRYQVVPYLLYFRDGHTYLDTTVLQAPPEFPQLAQRTTQFRIDRIVPRSARMLHEMVPAQRPPQPTYTIVYNLAPVVARNRDVAHWFPQTEIIYRDDGSARVTAQVTNLWQARQILMRYTEHCRVVEPPELVDMVRLTVSRMAVLYNIALHSGE